MCTCALLIPLHMISGYIKQVYLSYIPAMMLCGVLLMFGSVIMFFMPLFLRVDARRNHGKSGYSLPQQQEYIEVGSPMKDGKHKTNTKGAELHIDEERDREFLNGTREVA